MTTHTVNVPVPFQGTVEEAIANYNSHDWSSEDTDYRCYSCDCKPWHAAAKYPCGQEPPRVDVEVDAENPQDVFRKLHPGLFKG